MSRQPAFTLRHRRAAAAQPVYRPSSLQGPSTPRVRRRRRGPTVDTEICTAPSIAQRPPPRDFRILTVEQPRYVDRFCVSWPGDLTETQTYQLVWEQTLNNSTLSKTRSSPASRQRPLPCSSCQACYMHPDRPADASLVRRQAQVGRIMRAEAAHRVRQQAARCQENPRIRDAQGRTDLNGVAGGLIQVSWPPFQMACQRPSFWPRTWLTSCVVCKSARAAARRVRVIAQQLLPS